MLTCLRIDFGRRPPCQVLAVGRCVNSTHETQAAHPPAACRSSQDLQSQIQRRMLHLALERCRFFAASVFVQIGVVSDVQGQQAPGGAEEGRRARAAASSRRQAQHDAYIAAHAARTARAASDKMGVQGADCAHSRGEGHVVVALSLAPTCLQSGAFGLIRRETPVGAPARCKTDYVIYRLVAVCGVCQNAHLDQHHRRSRVLLIGMRRRVGVRGHGPEPAVAPGVLSRRL